MDVYVVNAGKEEQRYDVELACSMKHSRFLVVVPGQRGRGGFGTTSSCVSHLYHFALTLFDTFMDPGQFLCFVAVSNPIARASSWRCLD